MTKSKVTAEERLKKFHGLVQEANTFFGSKEIEKLAEKAGYRAIQAKDAVKMLIDENLVTCDKVGSSSIFWSLKSEATCRKQAALRDVKLGHEYKRYQTYSYTLKLCHAADLAEVRELTAELENLRKRYAELCGNDRVTVKELLRENEYAKEALLRWTDNICCVRTYMKNRLGTSEEEINKMFDIPPDIEDALDLNH